MGAYIQNKVRTTRPLPPPFGVTTKLLALPTSAS
jgi:hypothetical protein